MVLKDKDQLRKNITRWIRDLKKKLAKGKQTGGGIQKPLTEAEQLLFEATRSNKKSLDKNLRVIFKNPTCMILIVETVNTIKFFLISIFQVTCKSIFKIFQVTCSPNYTKRQVRVIIKH